MIIEVVSALIVRDGRALLIQRRPKPGWPSLDYVFATPGGKVERGESHAHALVRELSEELGLTLDPSVIGQVVYLARVGPPVLPCDVVLTCYVVDWSDVRGTPAVLDGVEGFAWFSADELRTMRLAPADLSGLSAICDCLYSCHAVHRT